MGAVLAMHRCKGCGKPASPVDFAYNDEVFATVPLCKKCLNAEVDEMTRLRTVFDAMIAAGVSRELANETMIFLIDRHPS